MPIATRTQWLISENTSSRYTSAKTHPRLISLGSRGFLIVLLLPSKRIKRNRLQEEEPALRFPSLKMLPVGNWRKARGYLSMLLFRRKCEEQNQENQFVTRSGH